MSTIWYLLERRGHRISELEVIKETPKSIVVLSEWCGKTHERRIMIDPREHFRTKGEALRHAYHRATMRRANAENILSMDRVTESEAKVALDDLIRSEAT